MTGEIDDWTQQVHTGDAAATLAAMPADSVHMCMTSPPYWQLRDYGEDGQLGLEDTPEEYVTALATVFDELKRVLRPDGSLWLNLGDTYADKDLQQIPARVALELQSRGWTLRNRVTWAKPNPMPSSVKDRLNTTTEAIFHLTPAKRYWYDLDAIREPHAESTRDRMGKGYENWTSDDKRESESDENPNHGGINNSSETFDSALHAAGKNPGDVFEVTTKPFPDAHFAVYPPELCEKPIGATAPPKVCVECGSPYERETEIERSPGSSPGKRDGDVPIDAQVDGGHQRDGHDYTRSHISGIETLGWKQTCDCDTDATDPGVVLDPFAGAGTTLLKAKERHRRFVGIELSPEYADMARRRIGLNMADPSRFSDDEQRSVSEWFE